MVVLYLFMLHKCMCVCMLLLLLNLFALEIAAYGTCIYQVIWFK